MADEIQIKIPTPVSAPTSAVDGQPVVEEETSPTKETIKRAIRFIESSDRDIPNPYQLTKIQYKELIKYKPELKNYKFTDVKNNPTVAEAFVDANIEWLEDKILDEQHRGLEHYIQAYYKPYAYKRYGYNWRSTDNAIDYKVWQTRLKNLNWFLQNQNKDAASNLNQ